MRARNHGQEPQLVGSVELWSRRLMLPQAYDPNAVQGVLTNHARQHHTTVIGYYIQHPSELALWHWPETRDNYHKASIDECRTSATAIGKVLRAKPALPSIVPQGFIHALVGLKKGGYDLGALADANEVRRFGSPFLVTHIGHLVSARSLEITSTKTGVIEHHVETYTEPAAIVQTLPEHEQQIHDLAERLRQHHYLIAFQPDNARTSGWTELYQTHWATEA